MGGKCALSFRSFHARDLRRSFSLPASRKQYLARACQQPRALPPQAIPRADDPVADPKAVVTVGHARFTVLTPQLIRMEWSADGKFEDHASFVFINRRLPVPKFTNRTVEYDGQSASALTIRPQR